MVCKIRPEISQPRKIEKDRIDDWLTSVTLVFLRFSLPQPN